MFRGKIFAFGRSIDADQKRRLSTLIYANQGTTSYLITAKVWLAFERYSILHTLSLSLSRSLAHSH